MFGHSSSVGLKSNYVQMFTANKVNSEPFMCLYPLGNLTDFQMC